MGIFLGAIRSSRERIFGGSRSIDSSYISELTSPDRPSVVLHLRDGHRIRMVLTWTTLATEATQRPDVFQAFQLLDPNRKLICEFKRDLDFGLAFSRSEESILTANDLERIFNTAEQAVRSLSEKSPGDQTTQKSLYIFSKARQTMDLYDIRKLTITTFDPYSTV